MASLFTTYKYTYSPPPQPAPTTGMCPVGLVTDLTLEQEFGPGASEITRCIIFNYNIKVIFRLNHLEYTPGTPITRPLTTLIDDYLITHGTTDFKVAAIIHSAGLPLALNRNACISAICNMFRANPTDPCGIYSKHALAN